MNRTVSAAVALLATALAASAGVAQQQPPQPAPRILVTGTVVDSVSGNPVFGVAIATTTTPDHTASDSTGAFTISIPGGSAVMLTFVGRGFETVGQVVTSTADVDLGRVALRPAVVALEPLEVTVSQLDERIRRFTGSVFVYDAAVLQHGGERDLLDFIMHHAGLHPSACNASDAGTMTECFLVRGYPTRPQLYVNEARLSQLSMLRIYRPEDVARVEVFSGGAMVRVYTRGYMEALARTNGRVNPIPRF
jgi:CarboxypepD_reg-like domain/TonB-dependent Receptor Plug Domain